VGFIQRFTLYLGRPVLVFSTVLGTLLVSSGLGSAFARRFGSERAPLRACLSAAGCALVCAFLAPLLVSLTLAWPAAMRVLTAVLILAPLGFLMGMPFPLLVRRLESSYPERIPWAWGVNGFASVVGSIGAVILGMTAGYTVVLLFGVLCYLLAALSSMGAWTKGQIES
jgi:predicted membrane-bound spermidine synthase